MKLPPESYARANDCPRTGFTLTPLGYPLIQFSNHSFVLFDRFFTNEKFKNQQISENEVLLEFELQQRQFSAFSCPRFGPATALQMTLAMRLQPVGAQPGLRVHHKL